MIKWSPRAKARLLGCMRYIAEESQDWPTVINWRDRVYAAVEPLNEFPESGSIVRELNRADIRQVKDCGKFSMVSFNAGQKKAHHEKQIPIDLERARQMGAKFAAVCAGSVTVR